MTHRPYSSEHLLRVGVTQPAFITSCYWGAEGGEENDVTGKLLEDVPYPLLHLCHHGGNNTVERLDANARRTAIIMDRQQKAQWQ